MDPEAKRPGSIAPILAGLVVLVVLGLLFLPLAPCDRCYRKRQEFKDWLTEPVIKEYRDKHPEEVAEVNAVLRKIDEDCKNCFHGRVTLWSGVFYARQ